MKMKKKIQYLKILKYCKKVQFSFSESENSRYSSHRVLRRAQVAMIGKTVDLIVVQETLIDTFHKEAKPQKVVAKSAGCSECCIKTYAWKVDWKEKCGRKRCSSNSHDRSFERIVKQSFTRR